MQLHKKKCTVYDIYFMIQNSLHLFHNTSLESLKCVLSMQEAIPQD